MSSGEKALPSWGDGGGGGVGQQEEREGGGGGGGMHHVNELYFRAKSAQAQQHVESSVGVKAVAEQPQAFEAGGQLQVADGGEMVRSQPYLLDVCEG